jgi:hypothetical protein
LGYARQRGIKLQQEFLFSEIEYILGRFSPKNYNSYLDIERTGRGIAPRINTALAAAALAYLSRDKSNEEGILLAANTPGSDTDTIGTMAGAILGAARPEPMNWPIQDREYITAEAIRISDIASGKRTNSFRYPDLISWSPPTTQSDAVGTFEGQMWLAGLGRAEPYGDIFSTSDAEWQWLRLDFGQTVLAKRRAKLRRLTSRDLPAVKGGTSVAYSPDYQAPLFRDDAAPRVNKSQSLLRKMLSRERGL